MSTSVIKFPFVQLMDQDLEELKFADLITARINSLVGVGRWHYMDEASQIAFNDIVLDAVKEMHFHCIRENLRLDCLEVALYDPVNQVPDTLPNEIKIPGNRLWIKLLCIVIAEEKVTEMATCKFYAIDKEWFYKIRPGFDEGKPVDSKILLLALGTTGMYKTVVTVPVEACNDYHVNIEAGTISFVDHETLSTVPIEINEFVVRLPDVEKQEL